jgi:DEAD/DEAH box helicase domain-containing protein
MDTLVFDIETQNFFTDPDVGWNNFGRLKISVVGVYSYNQDSYFCLEEDEMPELSELFKTADTLVGFSMNRYDIPVLNLYFKKIAAGDPALDLWAKKRVDLLDVVEAYTGHRISLSRLAEANLGVKKERHGSEAITLYKEGRMEELKEYCLQDVKLTKELYDMYKDKKSFIIPSKDNGESTTISFPENPASSSSQTRLL